MEKKLQADKVAIFQSRSMSRVVIVLKGDVEVTTPKLKELHKLLIES